MADTIVKGRYRLFNGTGYDTIHVETVADQVIETGDRLFVSPIEKTNWNSKAAGNHNHDTVYAPISTTYTKVEVNSLLDGKAALSHSHNATDIVTDTTRMFASKTEKERWNNTYTKSEMDSTVQGINDTISANETVNGQAHTTIITDYKKADSALDTKISGVQTNLDLAVEDLVEMINNGGTANDALASRVTTIETVTIPDVKKSVTTVSNNLSAFQTTVGETYATKKEVSDEFILYDTGMITKLNAKVDKTAMAGYLEPKADKTSVYTKEESNTLLSAKVDNSTYTTEIAKKVDKTTYTSDMAKKANVTDVDNALALKASKTEVNEALALKTDIGHKHTLSDISNAGTAAGRNVGTNSGQVPILDADGKLATSVLPSIAINQSFVAATKDDAMKLTVEIGDIVIVGSSTTSTYICIDEDATLFDDKFKPLQSEADVVTKATFTAELAKKVNVSSYEAEKQAMQAEINLKANAKDVYTQVETSALLAKKVDKVTGKDLSTNDFTNALKEKLEGISAGANDYEHPTGDGNLHVPATGTTNNKKVLMAGTTAGSAAWTSLTSDHITTTTAKQFVSNTQISAWDSKAEGVHTHDQYRLITDSYTKTQVDAQVKKMATIVSSTQPEASTQLAGAVWIELTAN